MKELQTVIAGTEIGITSLDSIVSAVIKDEKEIPIDVITQFDVLLPADVKLILDKVSASASEYFPHLKAIGTPSEQVFWKLQGRPRILMRYVQNLVRSNGTKTADELFDEYEKYICYPSNPYSKKQDSFGDLWMRFLSADDKTISFSLSKNYYQKDTPCNLALKTLAQSVQLRRADETGPFTCASFFISDAEFDTIRIGLFPLRSYGDYASEYYLAEPMVLNAGLLVVSSKPEWISLCTMNVLKRVVDHVANPQIAGSYFDTFIAMKFAWDERFRTKVL